MVNVATDISLIISINKIILLYFMANYSSKKCLVLIFALVAASLMAQQKATAILNADQGTTIINRNIYGHFSEHLCHCIYEGLLVGEDSKNASYKNCILKIKLPAKSLFTIELK